MLTRIRGGQARSVGAEEQADAFAGGERFDAFDRGLELGDRGASELRGGDAFGLEPDQGAAERGGEREDGEGAAAAGGGGGEGGERYCDRGEEEGGPGRSIGQREPGGDAGAEADREPERGVVRVPAQIEFRGFRPSSSSRT